jgi:hypothetical protein
LLHVAAKRNSPWISTSKLPSVAFYNYIREGYGVAAIDLSRIANRVEDVSGEIVGEGRFEQYARRHHEVLCVDGASTTAVAPSPLVAIAGRLQDLGFKKRAGAVFTVRLPMARSAGSA